MRILRGILSTVRFFTASSDRRMASFVARALEEGS